MTIKGLSRYHLAGLREVINDCADREDAKPIYRELMRLTHALSDKHDLGLRNKPQDMPQKALHSTR